MAASIFDLNTSGLSGGEPISRLDYEQLPPTRDVTGTSFPNGAIHFRWQNNGQRWWTPQKSYIKLRCKLSKVGGDQLDISDNVAPNMGLAASLFQSLEFRINDKTVSRVSDFVPQVDALETRLTKSKAWLEGVGNSMNFYESQYEKRQQEVVLSGVKLDQSRAVDIQTRQQLGYVAQTTAIALDTGVLTKAGGGPSFANVFQAGDEIEIAVGGAVGTVRYTVSNVLTANTLQLNNLKTIAVAAANLEWSRIRTSASRASRRVSEFELIWQPPLSIFKVGHAMPAGKYELILNPQTSNVYQKYAIESLGADKVPDTDYEFRVSQMYMYLNTVEGPRRDDITYMLDLCQSRCQSDNINQASFGQKNFDVSPTTKALTVAYQDIRAGTNTLVSSSKFKSYDAGLTADQELKLNRFYVNYAGQNVPSPDADPTFVPPKDYTTQRYIESQIHNGSYFDTGGSETLEEFHDRGSYYHFNVPKDGTDRSTRVTVHQQFEGTTDTDNMRILLFDHASQVARVTIRDGNVEMVELEDA